MSDERTAKDIIVQSGCVELGIDADTILSDLEAAGFYVGRLEATGHWCDRHDDPDCEGSSADHDFVDLYRMVEP